MQHDILGPDYRTETLNLTGGDVATVVSLPASPAVSPRGAILYIHGFMDYFFHDHVARYFTERGWTWYALDLRRNGRSLREGDEPWYTGQLTEYYEEIDLTIQRIQADGHATIVLMAHSTGGLTASIWAHDHRDELPISALVLNSPWLDLQKSWIERTVGTWLVRGLGAVRPSLDYPGGFKGVYSQSLHNSAKGEWAFDTAWKPLTSLPVKMGFPATVRRQHARLHKGLDVPVPVLQLRSDKSRVDIVQWEPEAHSTDIVLKVEQMKRWLPSIGKHVTDVPLTGAMHDVFLSKRPVRERALETVTSWLSERGL